MLEALAESYDRVFLAVSASQNRETLANLASIGDGSLIIGGHMGNGYAVEIANRLSGTAQAPVGIIVGEAPATLHRPREPAHADY
jgi:hypothetical protein